MKYRYEVVQSYLSGAPSHIEGNDLVEVLKNVQAFADTKQRSDLLEIEDMTDQLDVFFIRNGKRVRFMTLMAAYD